MSANTSKHYNFNLTSTDLSALARTYSVLANQLTLKRILSGFFKETNFDNYSKFELHSLVNEILYNNYTGEIKVKALLVDYFTKQNVISAFEIRANNSRLDFLRVNGKSISYEIKTELDTLTKLQKQVSDYQDLFEYNYIVIDEKHFDNAVKLIPATYGIFIVKQDKLKEERKAVLNNTLNPHKQLSLFTKKELNKHFKDYNNNVNAVLTDFSEEKINNIFKEMLKERYLPKWYFFLENKSEILPIDYQYFFNHNIKPKIIYGY